MEVHVRYTANGADAGVRYDNAQNFELMPNGVLRVEVGYTVHFSPFCWQRFAVDPGPGADPLGILDPHG